MAAQRVGLVSLSRVNPDTIGCARVDRGIRFEYVTCGQGNFKSGKEKLRIQKYLDTCG